MKRLLMCSTVVALVVVQAYAALPGSWPLAMQQVTRQFNGNEGVVLHVGDDMTYAGPYRQWATGGQGRTPEDMEILKWMHTEAKDETDGWYLSSVDVKENGKELRRSHTAASGLRADQLCKSGWRKLPALSQMLETYRPQIVVLMVGTNDMTSGRKIEVFKPDMQRAVKTILDHQAIPIISTIPPYFKDPQLAEQYNQVIREVAEYYQVPLIDLHAEMLARRPNDWNDTLMAKDSQYLSASNGSVTFTSAPTKENLSACGYLLRCWLTVQKIREVKAKAIDPVAHGSLPAKASR